MDNILKYSWDINKITQEYTTHSLEVGNPNLKIAIIDSGVDTEHPGLKNNVTFKKNFVKEEESFDFTGHGTMVCGQIAGDGAIKGIVPKCQLDVIKVLNKNNSCSFQNLIKALEYVYDNDYHIVNLSLGLSIKGKTEKELSYPYMLLKKLYEKNVICVNSVGYLESSKLHFPTNSPYTFTAQSLSRDGRIVNEKLFADYCVPSGDYLDTKLGVYDDYDEYTTVFFPFKKTVELKEKYPDNYNLPLGHIYSIGESLASAKLCGIITAISSKYLTTYNRVLSSSEVSRILSTHSIYIKGRMYPNLKVILNNIEKRQIQL